MSLRNANAMDRDHENDDSEGGDSEGGDNDEHSDVARGQE